MVAALRCVRPQFQWYQLAYATEMKSIPLHDYRRAQPKDSIHYITLHICIVYSDYNTSSTGLKLQVINCPSNFVSIDAKLS